MNDLLVWSLGKARQQTLNLVADLTEAQMYQQSVPGENHPAWTLGHLLMADYFIFLLLKIPNTPQMTENLWNTYGPGHTPPLEREKYLPKEQLVEQLIEGDRIRRQFIQEMTSADLAQPTPEPRIAASQPTLGHFLHYMLFHEGNHGGQLAAWRKTQGLPSGSGAFGVV